MMTKTTLVQMCLFSSIALLTGCKQVEKTQDTYGYLVFGDTVKVQDANWVKNIQLVEVKSVPYQKEVITAGTVRPIPTQYANIASPFAGRVVKSFVHFGQEVTKGTPLFEIISPDFTDAQKEYFQAQSSRDLARKDLKRKQDLAENGVCSQKDLEEAESNMLIAQKDFENAETALRVYQVDDLTSMTLGQPLVVRAPIDGLVVEDNIVVGQYIRDDADPIAVVADLSNVWVSAQVKEKDIRFIREDADLSIEIAAWPGLVMNGNVFHIEEEIDEDTRSIRVLSTFANPEEKLKLGMYTTVHFVSDPVQLPEVPETALLQGADYNYVFVQTAPDTYVRRPVTVENTRNHQAVISEGLQPGEKVIGAGGYYLKL